MLLALAVATVAAGRPTSVSVYPLQSDGRNVCTTTSIDDVRHYWLTAAHCIDGDVTGLTIKGDPILVIVRDVPNDIAILQTPVASAPALKLARKAPKVEDAVRVVGYPLGMVFQVTVRGFVAAVNGTIEEHTEEGAVTQHFTLFNLTGAPGNSGSSIVNVRGEVVSVLQVGWGRSFSPMIGGAVFETLATYRSYFGAR